MTDQYTKNERNGNIIYVKHFIAVILFIIGLHLLTHMLIWFPDQSVESYIAYMVIGIIGCVLIIAPTNYVMNNISKI